MYARSVSAPVAKVTPVPHATNAAQQARKLRKQAKAAEDGQMLGAAKSTAARGELALTERKYTSPEHLAIIVG